MQQSRSEIVREKLRDVPSCRVARRGLADIVAEPGPAFVDVPLLTLMVEARHMGVAKARSVLSKSKLHPNRLLGSLNEGEKERLISALRPFPEDS